MSGTLDKFLPPSMAKPKQDRGVFVEERCANPKCRKILKGVKYTLTGKHAGTYCQPCAKKILHPQENTEEI